MVQWNRVAFLSDGGAVVNALQTPMRIYGGEDVLWRRSYCYSEWHPMVQTTMSSPN